MHPGNRLPVYHAPEHSDYGDEVGDHGSKYRIIEMHEIEEDHSSQDSAEEGQDGDIPERRPGLWAVGHKGDKIGREQIAQGRQAHKGKGNGADGHRVDLFEITADGIDAGGITNRGENDQQSVCPVTAQALFITPENQQDSAEQAQKNASRFFKDKGRPEEKHAENECEQRRKGIEYSRHGAVDLRLGESKKKGRYGAARDPYQQKVTPFLPVNTSEAGRKEGEKGQSGNSNAQTGDLLRRKSDQTFLD